MNSKRTCIATFWRSNPQLKNGGYYTTKEFQAMSHKAAERQAIHERCDLRQFKPHKC